MYQVPAEYYIRIHHVRPRFKNDIESVLLYMAGEIAKLPALPKQEFNAQLNEAIYRYPGNATKTIKTIDNWRTEISSLFGFIVNDGGVYYAGKRAVELYESEDLVESFKKFLYTFQYPGAHIKSQENKALIEKGVSLKPAKVVLQLLQKGQEKEGKRVGISKAELCHCVLNDLRCVAQHESLDITWERIMNNRANQVEYDDSGDVVRYAGDILDYMEIANLLITHDSKMYYLNTLENDIILKFARSQEWFSGYDVMIQKRSATLEEINNCVFLWAQYVNRDLSEINFATDILAFVAQNDAEYQVLREQSIQAFESKIEGKGVASTKDIGDMGEGLIYSHECQRTKLAGRTDLVHLIQKIPTQLAVGYDIQSVEADARKRYVEVKTTISRKPLHFTKIHLTSNEWNTARSVTDRYFIYRLAISKREKKLFVLQNPVGLYQDKMIDMAQREGVEITFSTKKSGHFEELLAWEN